MKQNIIAFEVQEDCTLDYTNFEGGETIEIPLDDCPNDWKGIEWFEKYPQIFKPVYASPSTPVDEVKDKHTESKQPLYKVLNEKRTQGIWDEISVETNYSELAVKHPLIKDGIVVKHGIEYEFICRMDSDVIRYNNYQDKVKKDMANLKYTAIAVNNLSSLAEALEKINDNCIKTFEAYAAEKTAIPPYILNTLGAISETAKQALTRIS